MLEFFYLMKSYLQLMNEDNFFLFFFLFIPLSYLFNEQFLIQTKSIKTKSTTTQPTSAKNKSFKGCTNVDNTKQQNYGRQMQYARDVQTNNKKKYLFRMVNVTQWSFHNSFVSTQLIFS